MVSRSTGIRIILVVLAILVLFMPFLYSTSSACRIEKQQLNVSVTSPKFVATSQGGILTVKIMVKNNAGCDANIESLQVRMYRVVHVDNTTEDVDLQDTQVIHITIPAGGNATVNYAFDQPFTGVRPQIILAQITFILGDGSSLEVFDGPIQTTAQQPP